jgi:hypothetical protein
MRGNSSAGRPSLDRKMLVRVFSPIVTFLGLV